MIRDLADPGTHVRDIRADVLVIGGGIAGLLVATRLSRAGRRVVVAESGGLAQAEDLHPLNEVEQIGDVYPGAESGRFRCLGGTSTRWGGAMLPFQQADLEVEDEHGHPAWPIEIKGFTAYQDEIERLFDLPAGSYEAPDVMPISSGAPPSFVARLAKWPPFRLRNVATLLASDLASERGPEVWLHATATAFMFDPAGRLAAVEMRSDAGNILRVCADQTVLAAGAIESTRLMLLADRQHDGRIFAPDGVLGRYFHDHLSMPVGRLTRPRRKALNRIVGFRFQRGGMRNLRFEPSAELRRERGLPAGFVHVAFSTDRAGGFDALRDIYRKLQRRAAPSPRDLGLLAVGLPWLSRAVWWRFVEGRLLFPDGANLDLHVVIEQQPRPSNRIALSRDRRDRHGCELAAIDWRVGEDDAQNLHGLATAFAESWRSGSLSDLAGLEIELPQDIRKALAEGGGIYHPGGSVRMGVDAQQGVVDREFRTFRVPNLSVASTATFPTGGGANPTMMLMMAALKIADRLGQALS